MYMIYICTCIKANKSINGTLHKKIRKDGHEQIAMECGEDPPATPQTHTVCSNGENLGV